MAAALVAGQIHSGSYFANKHKKYEIYFKGHHVMHYPWGENTEEVPLLPGFNEVPFQNLTINVTRLCHYTHNDEADGIDRGDYFLFKPKPKCGKDYSNTNRETAIICNPTDSPPNYDTEYHEVGPEEKLFPGCYVWWFIDSTCLPTVTEDDPSILKSLYSYTISDPFIEPGQSRYGNRKISADLQQLIACYRQCHSNHMVQFQCGGTLRYNKQILKVVIVSTTIHNFELRNYPTMPSLNTQSVIVNIRNGVVRASTSSTSYSCDTYAFAFYFPNESCELKCPKPRPMIYRGIRAPPVVSPYFDIHEVKHNTSSSQVPCCAKVKNSSGSFVCPNDLPLAEKERKRRANTEDQPETKKRSWFSLLS